MSTGDILYNLRGDSVFTDVTAAGLVPFLYVPGILSAHLFRGAERWLGRWRCYERSGMTYRRTVTIVILLPFDIYKYRSQIRNNEHPMRENISSLNHVQIKRLFSVLIIILIKWLSFQNERLAQGLYVTTPTQMFLNVASVIS